MTTIISCTNRRNSEASSFATYYEHILNNETPEQVKLLKLEEIKHDWFHPDMYDTATQSPSLASLQDEYILPANKFIFVVPEYNGSFPGALKLFIDACSIREYKKNFGKKKIALVGIATGRAGNLRGLDHLTAILMHLGGIIYPEKVHIAAIPKLKDDDGRITDKKTREVIHRQIKGFMTF